MGKRMTATAERNTTIGTENAFKIGPHIARVEAMGKSVIRLNLGEPDFSVPSFIKETIKKELDADNTHYCDPKGILPLRRAIAQQMKEMRGLDVDPERVVVFPGLKPAIGFAQQIYCNPGDEVVYPSPGFPIYESFVGYIGAVARPLHLREQDGFSINAERLAEVLSPKTRLIYLNFPSNPTGGVATREDLEALARVIEERCSPDVRVFSDEIYEYIVYDGRKHISFASLPGMEKRTIIASGFSKTFAWTGGRIGYTVLPTVEEAELFKTLNINYFSCIPPYNQEGAREALENPKATACIQHMVSTFQQRRDVICKQLNGIPGVHCLRPSGAFYLFPNIRGVCENLGALEAFEAMPKEVQARCSPSTLFQMFALYEHQVAVMDRRSFGSIGSQDQHYLRLSIAADLDALSQGVERLGAAAQDGEGFKDFMDRYAEELF